jgi:single-stranded-DNA-specific exonuclease
MREPQQILEQILESRGIAADEQFLHPDFTRDVAEPEAIPGVIESAERLAAAIASGERITLFGDYDADGIPGVAVLWKALQPLGATVTALIPYRRDGYGLTPASIERIVASAPKLVVCIDNGTVSVHEIASLKAQNLDVIVIDHHELHGELAPADILVNPKVHQGDQPEREFCACALAWKVAYALWRLQESRGVLPEGLKSEQLKWNLDLVGFSTVADMVPLLGENRVLAQYGLQVLAKTRTLGLRALALTAGVELPEVNETSIGFRLAPRLNAAARVQDEERDGKHVGLQLLMTDDLTEASNLADHLEQANQKRQAQLQQAQKEAEEQALEQGDALVLVVAARHWESGIIGLVAGRLVERFHRPAFVCAEEAGQWKGSVRTPTGVDAVALMESVSSLLLRFGGHQGAGGLTLADGVTPEQLGEPLRVWSAEQGYTLEQFRIWTRPRIDLELQLGEVTMPLADALRTLAPFGIGFPEVRFSAQVLIESAKRIGSTGAHLQVVLREGAAVVRGVYFSAPEHLTPAALVGQFVDIIFRISVNDFGGTRRAEVQLDELLLKA